MTCTSSVEPHLPPEPETAPVAFGYLRLDGEPDEARELALEAELRWFAGARGWRLAGIVHEFVSGSLAGFAELVAEARQRQARMVVVPSLEHLARNRVLRATLVERLSVQARATIWAVRGDSVPEVVIPAQRQVRARICQRYAAGATVLGLARQERLAPSQVRRVLAESDTPLRERRLTLPQGRVR